MNKLSLAAFAASLLGMPEGAPGAYANRTLRQNSRKMNQRVVRKRLRQVRSGINRNGR